MHEFTELGLPKAAQEYLQAPDWREIERDLVWLSKPGNGLLTYFDEDYPALLREISQAPPLLFTHGDSAVLSEPQLAVVGTRQPTSGGQQLAESFAAHLAEFGVVITSGLALGIDAAAHNGALSAAEGRTVAVMATGLDRVYPSRNRDLAHAIAAQGGVLVSEFPPGTAPLAEHFPRRNRIISGLSLGTLVVEAALKSGSLITARLAVEQGREVFAIPGSVHNPVSKGCHSLIKQGAKLVETADDILEELGSLVSVVLEQRTLKSAKNSLPQTDGATTTSTSSVESTTIAKAKTDRMQSQHDVSLEPDYCQLLECLGPQPVAIDTLVERSGLTVEAVSSMLLILELQGIVATLPGGLYSLVKSEDD